MITFRISFLLAFSLLPKIPDEKPEKKNKKDKKKGKKDKKKSEKSSKKSDKSKKSAKSDKSKDVNKKEPPPKPDYVLETGNPIGYAHIEYELIPGRPKTQIDVVCWNKVAKVFLDEETITIRAKIAGDKIWVPIFVQHYVNNFENDALLKLYSHQINFTMATNKNKVNARAKAENSKEFYIKEQDVHSTDIVPAYTEDPNLIPVEEPEYKEALEQTMQDIIMDCIYRPGIKNKDEVITKLVSKDVVHTHRSNVIINEITLEHEAYFKEYAPVPPPPGPDEDETPKEVLDLNAKPKKKGKKKDKKGKKDKKKKADKPKKEKKGKKNKDKKEKKGKKPDGTLQIQTSGEIFFTDPNLSIYDAKGPNNVVTNAYVLLTVERLMTRQQKCELNPMVIKIRKIDNLPADVLKQHKFKSVYVRYNIPFVAQASTVPKEVCDMVRVNESHAHFTTEVPPIKFTEFMQSNRLILEICGIIDETATKEIKPNLFGTEQNDRFISKKMTPLESLYTSKRNQEEATAPHIILAVASCDLTSFLKPTWEFLGSESCHNPHNSQFQKVRYRHCDLTKILTTNEINLKILYKPKHRSPLSESLLLDRGTFLKVEVSFAAPILLITNTTISCADYYNRIFFIINNKAMAESFLNQILLYNQHVTKEIVVINHLNNIDVENFINFGYLTGFMIDNGNCYAFFLEGTTSRYIGSVWEQFMYISPCDMKIYFNDSNVFEGRLYSDFITLGGFITITLQRPLRDILAQEKIYLRGNVPLPCLQALKKLDLLFRSFTLKDILQYSLFPTSEELLSLDIEWGVPLRWNETNKASAVSEANLLGILK